MRCYLIKERLEKATPEDIKLHEFPYVILISREEFEQKQDFFDLGMDLEIDYDLTMVSRIRTNYDCLTGHLSVYTEKDGEFEWHCFPLALDEKGIVFINDDGAAKRIIQGIQRKKRWKLPSLERFLFDFLEGIVWEDLDYLEKFEKEMDQMEDDILNENMKDVMERLVDIRSTIMDLRTHYEQLIDVAQELEENENSFFDEDNLRFFRLFNDRCNRLQGIVMSLRDHTMQVRDLYNSQMDVKQNRNMSFLTIVATIFTPLTLITGWFGMNFKYMPILEQPWAYPAVCIGCVLLVVGSIIFFKKKKWL